MQEHLTLERYVLLHRMYERLGVAPGGHPGAVALSRVVVPVVELDNVSLVSKVVSGDSASLSAGSSSGFAVLTVPDDEQWELYLFNITRTSGDNTVHRPYINDVSAGKTVYLEYGLTAAATIQPTINIPLVLEPGDKLHGTANGAGASATVFRGDALVKVRKYGEPVTT